MVYSYYPGCTLKTRAKELDVYARASARALGVELEEIEDWQCCGGVYPLGSDETARKLSSVRALKKAADQGRDVVTVCSACHHVLKRVNDDMKNVPEIARAANLYQGEEGEYHGEARVIHYLELLRDVVGFDRLREKVAHPLAGRRIGAYYGCLLLRPSGVLQFDDPENPETMEEFLRALGAEPVVYPYRNECCGGYLSLKDRELSGSMVGRILESARFKGAEALVTACPLCRYNLINGGGGLPVYYFTELLAEALGVKEEADRELAARRARMEAACAGAGRAQQGAETENAANICAGAGRTWQGTETENAADIGEGAGRMACPGGQGKAAADGQEAADGRRKG